MNTYDDDIYPPGVVAEIFHVNPKTVTRWAREGKLPYFKTLGGHRRFRKEDVERLMRELASDVG